MIKRSLLLICLIFTQLGAAQAAYLSPALEVPDGTAGIQNALSAFFENEDETAAVPGHVLMARDVLFGETARRAESCAQMVQAIAEGFEQITQNTTPYTDDWVRARCVSLDILAGSVGGDVGTKDISVRSYNETTPAQLPALITGRASCADMGGALRATLRGQSWVQFENTFVGDEPLPLRVQPPAQFDVIAASGRVQEALVVTVRGPNKIGLLADGAEGSVERLAEYVDPNRDGRSPGTVSLVYLTWSNPVFGTYRSEVMALTQSSPQADYTVANPASALAAYVRTCPDYLGNVLNGPVDIQ